MSMPPSGLDGQGMDEEARIEAEIQFELDNINLDNDPFVDVVDPDLVNGELQEDDAVLSGDFNIPNELDDYIKKIQDQTRKFEQELEECDSLLQKSDPHEERQVSLAVIPYEDQQLLDRLALELGCSVADYKRKILEDIEHDDFEIKDELAEFISDDDGDVDGTNGDKEKDNNSDKDELPAITDGRDIISDGEQNVKLENEIGKAIEEGVEPSEMPVSQDLLPARKQNNGRNNAHVEIQQMLQEQLNKLETRYEERLEKLRKEEAFRKDEEEVREKRLEEERLWKRQELEREEQKLKLDQELAERKFEAEKSEAEKDLSEQIRKFQRDMAELQAETEREKRELERKLEEEQVRQLDRKTKAVTKIQSSYRGYRVRKINRPVLKEAREERMKDREEQRIKEVEKEIQARNEEKHRKEEEERLRKEEEKRKAEEFKRQKELEKQQREEEKRKKKEEEERRKQEEKRQKEEEKQKRKEEERRKREEEKRRKEEEEQRKKEEKKLKEEQEKQRKEEEKKRKEEEKRQKEEEKRQKEEEKKNQEEKIRKEEEEKKFQEDLSRTENNDYKEKEPDSNIDNSELVMQTCIPESEKEAPKNFSTIDQQTNDVLKGQKSESSKDKTVELKNKREAFRASTNNSVTEVLEETGNKQTDIRDKTTVTATLSSNNLIPLNLSDTGNTSEKVQNENTPRNRSAVSCVKDKDNSMNKIHQGSHIPHPPSPRKKSKSNLQSKLPEEVNKPVDLSRIDCLPEHLEALRLQFMKECQPWSKVSNEPWKLKTGISKKPLRRPFSAKKLPVLPDTVILQAAKVASLQQVTTVQLSDLPGNNISPLGQCWGLKYLSMNNCNLVAVDSLGQCKQLQYIDVQNNRIEYLDLKDVGQLQYLNASHNRLSSIHGLDNCSSLRWLDVSHNNITKLGGLDTLRRLNTLILSNNQLISADGLGATPTLQMIDMSNNHLQEMNDLEKLCLLLSLDLSSNNLLRVPSLKNQVLLQELRLSDNSISSLDGLSSVWLPLLSTLNLSQNSLSSLASFQNCVTLKKLDLSNNQLTEFDTISKCVDGCLYLENLILEDNPVTSDFTDSTFRNLENVCPRLVMPNSGTSRKLEPVKPRTSFETMCLTQSQTYRDIWNHFDTSLKSTKVQDLASLCDVHYKYCEKAFTIAVEYRNAHEYGEISVTMPTAPVTPKSGRPKSVRQKETFVSPKEMFENALKASNKSSEESGAINCTKTNSVTTLDSSPKDLFNQALKSAESVQNGNWNQSGKGTGSSLNGLKERKGTFEDKRMKAIVTIQAYWRGWLVRHEIAEHTRIWLAATSIQACWRGYRVRKQLRNSSFIDNIYGDLPPDVLAHLNKSATKIQAIWRGYNLRRKLLAALEYAQCNFGEEEDDEDAMMFGDDFDLDKFVSLDQNLLEDDWKPPDTPDIPAHHPVLKKPPSGRAKIPPIPLGDPRPPSNPRRAWRNTESPLVDADRVYRPPSSVASTDLTARTAVSKKEEKLSEEWGFKDTNTAQLMMQRAKKMKYNAERRTKIRKLDPKQRLALFRKLEEVTHPRSVPVPQRKTLPRKEYFKARQEEIYRQEQVKQEEYNVRASRTFEWLHTQVGDHTVSDSVINKGYVDGPRYLPENLPELQGIKRVQLTSPGSLDLQSVESVSSVGHRPRRSSVGTGSSSSKLPPIQTSSAPTQHVKERMSFRNPKVNQSVGWGGGKKRGTFF